MGIFRCNKCQHIREVENEHVGKSVSCPKCHATVKIYNTVPFINALIKKHLEQKKALNELRERSNQDSLTTPNSSKATQQNSCSNESLIDNVDLHNTDILSQEYNFEPIYQWFKTKQIDAKIDASSVDTRGFFDEVALALGDDYELLSLVSNQIKYIQNKGFENVKLDLNKKSSEEIAKINEFCAQLHDYSFVSKYHFKQKDKIIWLTLQTAPKIRDFFNGIWMEWFALMKILKFLHEDKVSFSCSRNARITFADQVSNELDLFFLVKNNQPIYIECKTGEFRQDIDKYLSLRKKLGLEKHQFVICIFGLEEDKAQGLTSMYDLTFVNEHHLLSHIQTFV